MQMTEVSQCKNLSVAGYMLNAAFSASNRRKIIEVSKHIKDVFGDAILNQPSDALHITLMDWVSPLVDYDCDNDTLFKQNFPFYDKVFSKQAEALPAFKVVFDTIKVSPAAIYIQGYDDRQFQSLRDEFIDQVTLTPATKQSPRIIHCTIARFDTGISVADI